MVSCRLALPSARDASIRAVEALLKEIDISPPHLLDWNPLHAVAIAVTESKMTAMTSRQPAEVSGM